MGTNKTYLPDKGSKEAQEIIRRCEAGESDQVRRELGYKNRKSFGSALNTNYGYSLASVAPVPTEDELPKPEQIILPEIKLREYKAPKGKRGDAEEVVLHCGDGHAAKITPSFDVDVYNARMDTMFDAIMTIVTLHRRIYPIRKIRIVNLGDNVQGENPFQGSKIGAVKMGVRDQIAKVAVPAWARLICSLRQEFEEVEGDCFPGNHGADKLAPETSKADFSFYDILKAKIGDKKGITINIHENFGEMVYIQGFKFFCYHGDQMPCPQGVPYFAMAKKEKSWYVHFGGFNYTLHAHFHKRMEDEGAAKYTSIGCGTLVSDDDWALQKMGISSTPSQNIFGVHPRFGVTWRYPLVVDYKFLPEKLPGDSK